MKKLELIISTEIISREVIFDKTLDVYNPYNEEKSKVSYIVKCFKCGASVSVDRPLKDSEVAFCDNCQFNWRDED